MDREKKLDPLFGVVNNPAHCIWIVPHFVPQQTSWAGIASDQIMRGDVQLGIFLFKLLQDFVVPLIVNVTLDVLGYALLRIHIDQQLAYHRLLQIHQHVSMTRITSIFFSNFKFPWVKDELLEFAPERILENQILRDLKDPFIIEQEPVIPIWTNINHIVTTTGSLP